MPGKRKHAFVHWLGRLLLLFLSAVILYLIVIFFNPQEQAEETVFQEPLDASPAVTLTSEDQLPELIADFPVPVLCTWGNTSLKLIAGSSYDAAYANRFGRVLALRYLYGETQVDVYSIYPADAFSILGRGDYHMSAAPSPPLSGASSVRMENETTIRIHIQTSEGLYAVLVPKSAVGLLSEIVRPLQLATVASNETQ